MCEDGQEASCPGERGEWGTVRDMGTSCQGSSSDMIWCHGVKMPWKSVMVPWCCGAIVSWCHGAMVSWCHGAMVSQCLGMVRETPC